jgi:hypothetical protein
VKVRAILVLVVVWVFLVCIGSAQAANPADIYPDNKVDWLDMKIMGENWLSTDPTPADIDSSGDVNAVDFAILANNWGWPPPPPEGMVFVDINDSGSGMKDANGDPISHGGFTGQMSKYETTNAQYCQFLNVALASGDVIFDSNIVRGADGSNSGADFVGEIYYNTYDVWAYSQITYSGGTFSVRSRDGYDMSNYPVVEVSWYGSTAFCNYYGYRLPTEWEWQAVADYDGSFIYGCGTSIDHSKANYLAYNPLGLSSYPYTSPVNYYSSYGYGMNDMAGNVWEWTSSCFFEECDPVPGGSPRFTCGGCWRFDDDYCSVSSRIVHSAISTYNDIGFRVCR